MKQLVVETERALQSLGQINYGPSLAEKSLLIVNPYILQKTW